MVEHSHIRINIPDRSYQAHARSEVKKMAAEAGFKDHRLGELEIIVAEITSNLVKHSLRGGYLLTRKLTDNKGIEIISVDDGPGMKLPAKMMEDGNSTTKTLGQGLGAINRLANFFDMYSVPGWGTVLVTRTYINKSITENKTKAFEVAALNVCKRGYSVSGDAWKFVFSQKRLKGLVIDGLGHGIQANEAAGAAVDSFMQAPELLPTDQLQALHQDLKKTRGAVINVVHIDSVANQIIYSGVGNIAMKVISPQEARGCFSYNGIVGHIMPRALNNHSLPWSVNDIVILHSDGITGRWDIQKYPTITKHHPMILCVALYKDFDRGTDDSTIVLIKYIK